MDDQECHSCHAVLDVDLLTVPLHSVFYARQRFGSVKNAIRLVLDCLNWGHVSSMSGDETNRGTVRICVAERGCETKRGDETRASRQGYQVR